MQNNNGHYQYTKDFEDYSNKRKEKVLRGALGCHDGQYSVEVN